MCRTRESFGLHWPANVYLEQVNAGGFAEGTLSIFNFLANSMDEGVENFEDLGCPKNQKILDPKAEKESRFASATHSATRLNFTAQSRMQIGMASGPCSTWDFKYYIVLCTVRVTVIKSFLRDFNYCIKKKMSIEAIWLITKFILTPEKFFSTILIRKKTVGLVGKNLLEIFSHFSWYCWKFILDFGKFNFQKFMTNQMLWWKFVYCIRIHSALFFPRHDYFYKSSRLWIIGRSVRDEKKATHLLLVGRKIS